MGMGHFFRMMHLHQEMRSQASYVLFVLLGEHLPAQLWLEREGIAYVLADESQPGWERELIERYRPAVWVNDRLTTDAAHVTTLQAAGIAVVTFDDTGTGAALAELHISALGQVRGEPPVGKRLLQGLDYLILPSELERHRRVREHADSMVVSLGGSDTYGMTVKTVTWLAARNKSATIVLGPGFMHEDALQAAITDEMRIERSPRSLVEVFSRHDVAVTGGGITAFEAAASGLPTFTIANELHEIAHCQYLERLGCSKYLGYRDQADPLALDCLLSISGMSSRGMDQVALDGAANICGELLHLVKTKHKENP